MSNNIAASSSLYVDSLVKYVLDVKPYHTKLTSTGAVSEGYIFSDTINVNVTDQENIITTFLGADLLPAIAVPGGNRARLSPSWWHDITSDGALYTFDIPNLSIPKFASSASLKNFKCGVDDYTDIIGLPLGGFNTKRWDGPGITDVQRNSVHQQDTIDYTLSHGIYSVHVEAGDWIETDVKDVVAFSVQAGALTYDDVARSGGTIGSIVNGNYEEWVITTYFVDPSSILPARAHVVGSVSGDIGFVEFNQTFTSSQISFFWGPAPSETIETTIINDVWTLTPSSKITVNPAAPTETWSIIKSNPISLSSKPIFLVGATARTDTPVMEVHTRSLDIIDAANWTITFSSSSAYTLNKSSPSLNGITYPISINLTDGYSYKNADIAYTIIPPGGVFNSGDIFSWSVGSTITNYKVYGSISGWKANAKIGEWYWNGLIGFKIPTLKYFTSETNLTILKPVHSIAESSVYTITFATSTKATVSNNLYGQRAGLTIGQNWADEFCSFKINNTHFAGDIVRVYLATSYTIVAGEDHGYDVYPYELVPYDLGDIDVIVPLYNTELFQLSYGYGAVIWHKSSGIGTSCALNDTIIIDKTFYDTIQLQITNASTLYPELGADVNNRIPLEIRYYDNVNPTPINGNYTPTSNADFSDLATYIQAYSGADPSKLVFSVLSPRFLTSNIAAQSTIVFDHGTSTSFFEKYLPFNTRYSLKILPDESYGQTIRVKITEHLKIENTLIEDILD